MRAAEDSGSSRLPRIVRNRTAMRHVGAVLNGFHGLLGRWFVAGSPLWIVEANAGV